MKKNLIVVVLMILIVIGTLLSIVGFNNLRSSMDMLSAVTDQRPLIGSVFKNFTDYRKAYLIYPGEMTPLAAKALKGWTLKSTVNRDGSTVIDLIPSNNVDRTQHYFVRKGESLYFVEKSPLDDNEDTDGDLLDDYGVVVGSDGLVN